MVVAAAALCLAAPASTALPASHDTAQILIKSFMFTPMELTVKAGATVTWSNMDDEPHSVVSDTGLFRSGAVDTHETFSFKFDKPGTYHFICSLHPRMSGTIVVE
jgi:plastocyanin